MEGTITVVCDSMGVRVSVRLEHMKEHDNILLLHAIGKVLKCTPQDYQVMSMAEDAGVLSGVPVESFHPEVIS